LTFADRSTGSNLRTGGRVLIDQLRIHGAERAFCVPGESYLAALDALHDAPDIALVVCRHESGAAMMAEAYGKLTGRPGIAFVTRGPGATNASGGLHIAQQDSTPMILFIGQIARETAEREAFQEIDYRRMLGPLSKWVAQIDAAERIPEFVARAFAIATSGRPGPVVLALPEDMLTDRIGCPDARRYRRSEAAPLPAALTEFRTLLERAERPFAIIGGGDWDEAAFADFQVFAAAWQIPVGTSFRAQSHFDNTHRCYAGDIGIGINPELAARVREADLLIVLGARLGEMTTSGYTLIDLPVPRQPLVHVYPDPSELGRTYQPTLPIQSSTRAFAAAAAALEPLASRSRAAVDAAHAQYCQWSEPRTVPGSVQLGTVIAWLSRTLPDDAIIASGAGNYNAWIHNNYRFRRYRTHLGPTSGSMGYGTPAAIAAKLLYPERVVLNIAGDGCFLMNAQELATAAQYGAAIIVIVVNNGLYGTIRMHQEREYPGRVIGTTLHNPDFAALARAYGCHGETVASTEDFYSAFERCRAAAKPALIDLRVDPEAITPRLALSDIRRKALARG
jgi:acetolactate synthase-1/2/3 large subunit